MKNNVTDYTDATALIEEDPYNNRNQAPIYLSLDWEEEIVDVTTYYRDGSTPGDVWHGRRSLIRLPNNVDASCTRADVEALMPRIEKIAEGYESKWDGSNWRGAFTEEVDADLQALEQEIEYETHFTLLDEGGLWDADEWFQDPVEELTAETADEEIKALAETYEEEARSEGVVIRGGVDSIEEHFRNQRDEL